jgi:hypothetical protein
MAHWDYDLVVRVPIEGIGYQKQGQASVNTAKGEAMKFCPSCGADIAKYIEVESGHPTAQIVASQPTVGKYDAVSTWKALLAIASDRQASPPSVDSLVSESLEGMKPGKKKAIVHIAFDQDIVPRGGVLYRATLLEGRTEMDVDRLRKLGYAVDKEGHLVIVDDVPVGNAYQTIMYWGGTKQHKRWHLKYPVEVNPARNGDLYFMDENIVAFGTDWLDTGKMHDAFTVLLESFMGGHGHSDAIVGTPLAFKLVFQ